MMTAIAAQGFDWRSYLLCGVVCVCVLERAPQNKTKTNRLNGSSLYIHTHYYVIVYTGSNGCSLYIDCVWMCTSTPVIVANVQVSARSIRKVSWHDNAAMSITSCVFIQTVHSWQTWNKNVLHFLEAPNTALFGWFKFVFGHKKTSSNSFQLKIWGSTGWGKIPNIVMSPPHF